ncbi:receptor kinase-like protein Xa21 [Camellia sinensis]|nr:receptor kinase-like protein Xa21 [Camellia sinensis]
MGQIPKEIGSLRNLNELLLAGSNLNGNIPSTIGGIERLQRLHLSANNFHGSIPSEICLLRNLGEIYLQENKLSGSIPSCITKLSSLQVMDISSNKLTLIPSSLWNLENLRLLNLSFNSLNGSLDPHKALEVLESMDLSWNQISGNIPRIIGSFQRLASLNLSRNSFSGPIPNSIGNLVALDFLDLSLNNLSGPIPKSLDALSHLKFLNLSCNKLLGEIPSKGPFTNLTALSFIGNEELCGDPILQVQPCPNQSSQRLRAKDVVLRYIVPAIALLVIFSSLLWIVKRHHRKNVRSQHSNDLLATIKHKKISYQELQRATTNFCEANLLGVGSYGSVYKGILSDGTIVAIKILNLQVEGAFRSFDTECEVLRTMRHRNLVRVITTCSNPELRALVLQYMSNGSLDKWLYSNNYCLNLFQRVSIMIYVALALEYLHDGQSEPVVHCDLKPSNVLLDEDIIAHVADFSIAKILAENKTAAQTNTLGTLGYIAPECGFEGRVSTSGDIYSYGIMLLETFTRKKPTDEMFTEEMSLRQWVSTLLPDEVMEVVDSGLLRTQNAGDMVATQSNLIAILELGLECCRELVAERIQIKEVLGKLNKIKRQLLQKQSV